jgi:hypothetical protein
MTARDDSGGTGDEGIRRVIKTVDPARSLVPASEADIIRLKEEAMTDIRTDTSSGRARPRPFGRRAGFFGAVGAVGAAAVTAIILPLALGPSAAVTELTQPAPGGPAASCAPVSADYVARAQSAFSARVTSIDNGTVTLEVLERFAGDISGTVRVAQGPDAGVDGEAITFQPATTYLIATKDDMILTCGTSGPDGPELSTIYSEAFPS